MDQDDVPTFSEVPIFSSRSKWWGRQVTSPPIGAGDVPTFFPPTLPLVLDLDLLDPLALGLDRSLSSRSSTLDLDLLFALFLLP